MAIAFVLQFDNMGQDNYDAVMKELGFDAPGAKWPEDILRGRRSALACC